MPTELIVANLEGADKLPVDGFVAITTSTIGIMLSAAYCVPLFFAGVIFAETFRRATNKSGAFGSNIIGAVAGGLAQNLSFVIGLKALLLLAAVFYTFAGLFTALGLRRASAGAPQPLAAPTN